MLTQITQLSSNLPKSINNYIEKYQLSFWVRFSVWISFFLGILIQLFFIAYYGAWRFFSIGQVLIDGFFFLGILTYTSLLLIITLQIIKMISKTKEVLIRGLIISLLVGLCFLVSRITTNSDFLIYSFMPIVILLSFHFFVKSIYFLQVIWCMLIMILSIFMVLNRSYNSVEISGKTYNIKYFSTDYIFTKEGYIFDRNGNKFTKTP